MRFGEKDYYVASYVKCANCGILIHDAKQAALQVQDLQGHKNAIEKP